MQTITFVLLGTWVGVIIGFVLGCMWNNTEKYRQVVEWNEDVIAAQREKIEELLRGIDGDRVDHC